MDRRLRRVSRLRLVDDVRRALEDPKAIVLVADNGHSVIGYAYAAVEGYDYMSLRAPAGVLPGAQPEFFFAPTQIQKRTQDCYLWWLDRPLWNLPSYVHLSVAPPPEESFKGPSDRRACTRMSGFLRMDRALFSTGRGKAPVERLRHATD